MRENNNYLKYLLLYVPYFLSIFIDNAITSYFIAWLGSFYIFYMSMSGKIKPIPTDLTIYQQLLRPLFLIQIIFAGYMACTSVFFFLNALGYTYFTYTGSSNAITDTVKTVAKCQQMYVLGHAALTTGLLLAMDYPVQVKSVVQVTSLSTFLLKVSILCFPLSFIFNIVPALGQFSVQTENLSLVACAMALAASISEKNARITVLSAALYVVIFIKSATSGYKEPVIVSFLLLGIFLFPVYGKKLLFVFAPLLIAILLILPTYVNTFRSQAWSEGASVSQAKDEAISALSNTGSFAETNWGFLTGRISEISMFIQFYNDVPVNNSYYGFQIAKQALYAIIPRAFWPSKPVTESLVMERVYRSGVIDPIALVSAKPATVVDGYLSGGPLGVWVSLFLYGLIAQFICIKAEQIFGGFVLGTALMYTGLFLALWRGNSFEFLVNNVFWSYVGMWIAYYIFKRLKVIVPIS